MKAEDFIKDKYEKREDKDNILPPATDGQEGLCILYKHFLGEDWYVVDPLHPTQINTVAIAEILKRYPSGKFRRIQKERKRKCLY